ncbi:atherin-like [Erinaceus europaeus]|uniref:Atherin-like n=1 Tax=Erinaceus europaeus TaxID=9365 RepID=A0ABM3YB98_ERIEU|nr:atherin-like [Erinaceus europaeus]
MAAGAAAAERRRRLRLVRRAAGGSERRAPRAPQLSPAPSPRLPLGPPPAPGLGGAAHARPHAPEWTRARRAAPPAAAAATARSPARPPVRPSARARCSLCPPLPLGACVPGPGASPHAYLRRRKPRPPPPPPRLSSPFPAPTATNRRLSRRLLRPPPTRHPARLRLPQSPRRDASIPSSGRSEGQGRQRSDRARREDRQPLRGRQRPSTAHLAGRHAGLARRAFLLLVRAAGSGPRAAQLPSAGRRVEAAAAARCVVSCRAT